MSAKWTFGSTTIDRLDGPGAFVLKYDSNLQRQWVQGISTPSAANRGLSLSFDSVNNRVITVGFMTDRQGTVVITLSNGTNVTGAITPGYGQALIGFLATLDPTNGNILNAAFGDYFLDVRVFDGFIYAAGGAKTTPAPPSSGVIAKIDPISLQVIKQWIVVGNTATSFNSWSSLALDSTGNIFVGGSSSASPTAVGINPTLNLTAACPVGAGASAFIVGKIDATTQEWSGLGCVGGTEDGSMSSWDALAVDLNGRAFYTFGYSLNSFVVVNTVNYTSPTADAFPGAVASSSFFDPANGKYNASSLLMTAV